MEIDRIKTIESLKNDVKSTDRQYSATPIGLLTAETNLALADSIEQLQRQISVTISELRKTISLENDKSIKTQQQLAESNDKHSRAMIFLTLVIAAATIVQAFGVFK